MILGAIDQLVWPAKCLACGKLISADSRELCEGCWQSLMQCTAGDYCLRCGLDISRFARSERGCPDCEGRDFYFDGIARVGRYSEALRRMVLAVKRPVHANYEAVLGPLAMAAFEGGGFSEQVDMLVPVPLHWRRKLVRRTDHTLRIIKALKTDLPVSRDLVRVRHTPVQSSRTYIGRARNVKGAFAVRAGHRFAGRNVCLLDDIKTSGATLNECARTLKQAGAGKVFALVIAVAAQKQADRAY